MLNFIIIGIAVLYLILSFLTVIGIPNARITYIISIVVGVLLIVFVGQYDAELVVPNTILVGMLSLIVGLFRILKKVLEDLE